MSPSLSYFPYLSLSFPSSCYSASSSMMSLHSSCSTTFTIILPSTSPRSSSHLFHAVSIPVSRRYYGAFLYSLPFPRTPPSSPSLFSPHYQPLSSFSFHLLPCLLQCSTPFSPFHIGNPLLSYHRTSRGFCLLALSLISGPIFSSHFLRQPIAPAIELYIPLQTCITSPCRK